MDKKIFVLAISIALDIVLMNIFSTRNIYALKNEDGRYGIVRL